DRAGALRHANIHSELLRADLDAAPEREVVAFAERLRLESRPAPSSLLAPVEALESAAPLLSFPPSPSSPSSPSFAEPARRKWLVPAVMALVLAAGLAGLGAAALAHNKSAVLNPRRVAVAVFENHTGRRDLDDLGSMTADWIIRGLMETPLI